MRRVYLDNNATTPVRLEVLEAMRPYFGEHFGNASSIHHHGQETRAAVERARESVANLLGCRPAEVVFTSGGTEADNLAIFGLVQPGDHVADAERSRRHPNRGRGNPVEVAAVAHARRPVRQLDRRRSPRLGRLRRRRGASAVAASIWLSVTNLAVQLDRSKAALKSSIETKAEMSRVSTSRLGRS